MPATARRRSGETPHPPRRRQTGPLRPRLHARAGRGRARGAGSGGQRTAGLEPPAAKPLKYDPSMKTIPSGISGLALNVQRSALSVQRFALALLALSVSTPLSAATPEVRDAVKARVDAEYASLETIYKDLHAHPELSFMETRTAAL